MAAKCSNSSDINKNVSFHKFPKKETNEKRYAEWVRQVKRTRAEWNGPTSADTHICSEHFTEECFEKVTQLKEEVGYRNNAVPTLFQRTDADSPVQNKPRTAFQKRQRMSTINECINESTVSYDSMECTDISQSVDTDP